MCVCTCAQLDQLRATLPLTPFFSVFPYGFCALSASASPSPLRSSTCVFVVVLAVLFLLPTPLPTMRFAQNNPAYYCVPSSSLHAHDKNMAEFASMAGMQIIVKLREHVCACYLPLGQTSSRTRKDMQQITIQYEWTAPALRGTNKPPRTQSTLSH